IYEESTRLNNINGYLIKSYVDINYEYTKIIKVLDDIAIYTLNKEVVIKPEISTIISKFIEISDKKDKFDLNNINI
ncbi:MAG: hypothetical protein K5892_01055, partial [Acholeplasmatales bacterium]|nr:hypothetical protein [Acholeplasmatales bacterium]